MLLPPGSLQMEDRIQSDKFCSLCRTGHACQVGRGLKLTRHVSLPVQEPLLEPTEAGARSGERGCNGSPAPPFTGHLTMMLSFYGGLGFFHERSWLLRPTLQPLQAVSTQPTAVPSLVCPLNPMFQQDRKSVV